MLFAHILQFCLFPGCWLYSSFPDEVLHDKMPVREDFLSSSVPGEVRLVFLGCYVGTHLLFCTVGTSLLSQSSNTWQKGYRRVY